MMEKKMFRTHCLMIILGVFFIFQGCAVMQKVDGSTEEELQKFGMSRDEMWDEMQRLESENEKLQSELSILREEHQRGQELISQAEELRQENEALRNEKAELENRLSELQQEEKEFEEKVSAPGQREDLGTLRIKELSGDGQISSAKQMAERLRKMGYEVESVDWAPRRNFSQNTVYFAPSVEKQANDLVTNLGGGTVSKPFSWDSVFDLIVVTSKTPFPTTTGD
jgi:predicted nuclease with TOPRIM domain